MKASIEATMKFLFFILTIASMHSSVVAMDGKPNLRRQLVQQDPCEILIRVVNHGVGQPHKQEITCQMSPNDGGRILELDNISPQWLKTNKNNFKSGQMELFAPGAKIQGNKLRMSSGINPELRQKKIKNNQGNNNNNGNNNGKGNGNNEVSSRNLATTIDNDKTVLVLRVNEVGQPAAQSAAELSDSIFGTNGDLVNLKSQMAACSKDQLIINAASGNNKITNGVMEVTIDSVQGRDKYTVEGEAVNAMEQGLGCASAPCGFDHVMVCLPPGTSGSWIAYAYMNSYLSVYNNAWCTYVSTQMHEVGHNLNLGHSGEGTQEYGDTSGMMGYSYSTDDGPEMCFNGVKSWDLGWYSGGHASVGYSQSWEGTLTSVADYNLSNPQTTLVQVTQNNGDKYYIMYNRNTGINAGTQEGANQVLITKKTGTKSNLVAKLGQDQTYFPFQGFMVKTGVIASGEASVLINKCYSNADCHDGDVCTIDSCVNNQCSHVLANECTYWDATVRVTTDNYPRETSWTLVNECTGITELSGGTMTQLNTEHIESRNVPMGRYKFTINDQAADGICCGYGQGSYSVTIDSQTVGEGGEFGSSAVHTYGECSTDPPLVTPAPTLAPVTANPTPAPITPNPTLAPITPSPTLAPVTPVPTPAPITPNPTPTPITPNPTPAPITPNPTPAPITLDSTPAPTTSAPVVTYWEATVRVTTDNYPRETSWTLINECTGITELSGGTMTQLNTEYIESRNIPMGRYKFTINDQEADGICCGYGQGSYSVTIGSQTIAEGGEFGSSAVHTYGECSTDPPLVTPAPTLAPVTANPTPAPITPNPTLSPITPSPTLAPVTPVPTPAPITPNPTPAPITPAPVAVPTTPAPVPTTPAPVPTTPAPVPTTPAPVPTTPAPVPTTSAPVPTTLAPVNTPPSLGPLTDITFDTFENGQSGSSYIFEKNGGDAKVDDKKSKNGNFSSKLKKGGYIEHRTSHAVSQYTQLEVSFSFYHKFDRTDDKLSVVAITDSGNYVLATYKKDQYLKETWHSASFEFQNEFNSMKLKFVATTNRKEVFIDDVDFNAR